MLEERNPSTTDDDAKQRARAWQEKHKRLHAGPRQDFRFGFALPTEKWVEEKRRRLLAGEPPEAVVGPDRGNYYLLESDGIRLIGAWGAHGHAIHVLVVESLDKEGRTIQRLNRQVIHLDFSTFAEGELWCAEVIEMFRPRAEGRDLEYDWYVSIAHPQYSPCLRERVKAAAQRQLWADGGSSICSDTVQAG
jgi:hypothetical protein